MTRRNIGLVVGLCSVAAVLQMACIADILVPSRRLPGSFRLIQFEQDFYYVEDSDAAVQPNNGFLQGSITRLGWSPSLIVARREGWQPSGWMLVHVRQKTIEGPFTDTQFEERRRLSSDLATIEVHDVQRAWSLLD